MGSKTKKQKQAEEKIKRAIVDGARRGVCDKEGNSKIGSHGGPVPVYQKRRPTYTKVYKWNRD